jgi:hypothetical protein
MKRIGVMLVLLLAVGSAASAAPAPWYKWRSKLSGAVVCEQVMNGDDGWVKIDGPFKDAHCTKRA